MLVLKTIEEILSANIKRLRGQDHEWSQGEMARKTKAKKRTLQRVEKAGNPRLSTLKAIADGLGVTLAELFTDPDSVPRPDPAAEALLEKLGQQQREIRDLKAKLTPPVTEAILKLDPDQYTLLLQSLGLAPIPEGDHDLPHEPPKKPTHPRKT